MNEKANQNNELPRTDVATATTAVVEKKPENPGVVPVMLSDAFTVDGKDITEISLNFAKLTAKDHINMEEEMVQAELTVMKNVAFSTTYCLYIAARASGINIGDLERLSFKDTNKVIAATRNFMRDSE